MLAMMAVSAGISAIGAVTQGMAASAAAHSRADAERYNAKIAEQGAKTALEQANAKEEMQRRNFAVLQGKAFAGAAESGAGFSVTNQGLLDQNAVNNEYDALTIRYQGLTRSTELQSQAGLLRAQAGASDAAGDMAMIGGVLGAGAQAFGGAARYYAGGVSMGGSGNTGYPF